MVWPWQNAGNAGNVSDVTLSAAAAALRGAYSPPTRELLISEQSRVTLASQSSSWGGVMQFFWRHCWGQCSICICMYLLLYIRSGHQLNRFPFVSRRDVDMPSHMETVKQWGMMRWINCAFWLGNALTSSSFHLCVRVYNNITNIKYFILYKEIRLYYLITLIQQPENHSGFN